LFLKFIFIFFNFKNNFQNFKNIFKNLILCGTPRQRHVAKVAQSATATWPKPCQISWIVGPWSFFKQFLFYRDENQNWTKLQRRLWYLSPK